MVSQRCIIRALLKPSADGVLALFTLTLTRGPIQFRTSSRSIGPVVRNGTTPPFLFEETRVFGVEPKRSTTRRITPKLRRRPKPVTTTQTSSQVIVLFRLLPSVVSPCPCMTSITSLMRRRIIDGGPGHAANMSVW